jgi:hypothetical protein
MYLLRFWIHSKIHSVFAEEEGTNLFGRSRYWILQVSSILI